MEFFISFFRDVIDGWMYFVYIFVCIFFVFVAIGMYGDKKREAIQQRLKEKKARDIASGKEARIAALESKQVLDVMEGDADQPVTSVPVENNNANDTAELSKKEEAPSVLVIGDNGSSNTTKPESSEKVQQEAVVAPQVQQPVVIEQSAQAQQPVQVQQPTTSNNNAV